MKKKIVRWAAIIFIIEIGLIHYFSSQHEFEESWILGYMFIANFLGALVSAYGIYRRKKWGWILGLLISIGSSTAYIWSRTSGLPGLRPEEWFYPWGVLSLLAEGIYLLLFFLQIIWRNQPEIQTIQSKKIISRRLALITAGVAVLVMMNFPVYQLDAAYPELDHEHVFFLWQVKLQPEISMQSFNEDYGMNVSLAAVSAMNSIIDVRVKVNNPEKANPLLEEGHFALLVGNQLIPAPHIHRHMLKNKTVIILFPNKQNMIKPGTQVSIVFENLRTEPVLVE